MGLLTVDCYLIFFFFLLFVFFFQAEDGIRDLVRSRVLGDVYKRQLVGQCIRSACHHGPSGRLMDNRVQNQWVMTVCTGCLLYTSDAADERSSVDLGGRRIIKKKKLVIIRKRSRTTSISSRKQLKCVKHQA